MAVFLTKPDAECELLSRETIGDILMHVPLPTLTLLSRNSDECLFSINFKHNMLLEREILSRRIQTKGELRMMTSKELRKRIKYTLNPTDDRNETSIFFAGK